METDEYIRTFSPHASIRDFLPDCTDNSDRQGTISIIAIMIYITSDHSFLVMCSSSVPAGFRTKKDLISHMRYK